jgi:hypothetical protein
MSDDDDSLAGIPSRVAFSRKKGKVGAQKFTKSTKAYKHLEKLFMTKQILPTEKPSDVRQKDPLFMDFTHQQFRSQFNKLKGTYGTVTTKSSSLVKTASPNKGTNHPFGYNNRLSQNSR